MDAFAAADPGGADEQECICVEIIGSEQLLLQELIVLQGKRFGKIAGSWREVFSTNEIGLNGVAVGGKIIQQATKTNEVIDAGCVTQGQLLFTQPTEPAEQMGIAAQLRKPLYLRKLCVEIEQEAPDRTSIVVECAVL